MFKPNAAGSKALQSAVVTVACGGFLSGLLLKYGLESPRGSHQDPQPPADPADSPDKTSQVEAQNQPRSLAPPENSPQQLAQVKQKAQARSTVLPKTANLSIAQSSPAAQQDSKLQPISVNKAPQQAAISTSRNAKEVAVPPGTDLGTPAFPKRMPVRLSPLKVPQLNSNLNKNSVASVKPLNEAAIPEVDQSQSSRARAAEADLGAPIQLSDVQGHWAHYFIQALATEGIVEGYADSSFRPDAPIKPDQFALMTEKAFESKSPLSFRDLQAFVADHTPTRAEAAMLIHETRLKNGLVSTVTDMRVRGEVNAPGRYSLAGLSQQNPQLSQLPTVSRAIAQAGGLRSTADLRRVQIRRTAETGEKYVITLNLRKPNQDIVLAQGDEVVIPPAVASVPSSASNSKVFSTQTLYPAQKTRL